MLLFILAILIWLAAGLAAGFLRPHPRAAAVIGLAGAVTAGFLGTLASLGVLRSGISRAWVLPWRLPYASFTLGVDPLSAFFLLLLFALSGAAALFGYAYLRLTPRKTASHWLFFNLFLATMAAVLLARNGVLFLVAWEAMSVASFFLVTLEHEKPGIPTAGWIYLVAAHLGMACLLLLFLGLGLRAGSLEFAALRSSGALAAAPAFWGLALLGFGTKAGFVPLHVWLPEAHPAAPSHVSALMSGVMITLGIYGLLRLLSWSAETPAGLGYALLGIGAVSAVLGAVPALAQRDLKRLLAYSSVENMGLIAIGLGVGVFGTSSRSPMLILLGFGGALLHVLNHALVKSLLFLAAGAIARMARTLDLERLGGLLKEMPRTGALFFLGAAALCGLPPLNVFVGEWLLYLGLLKGGLTGAPLQAGAFFAVAAGMALAGALALAAYAKAFGIAFLGRRRRSDAPPAADPGPLMLGVMAVLGAAVIALGLFGAPLLKSLLPVVAQISGQPTAALIETARPGLRMLGLVAWAAAGWWVLLGLIVLGRRRLLARRTDEPVGTWDCGYAAPDESMQYSASSFVEPITRLFGLVLRIRRAFTPPQGLFPVRSEFRTETPSVFRETLFSPAYRATGWLFSHLRWMQHGRVQGYALYILLALLALLAWKLGA